MKTIREKSHRLPRDRYQGQVTVAFTVCMKRRESLFVTPQIVSQFVGYLKHASDTYQVQMLYTFMPDHLHCLSIGQGPESDSLGAIEGFKHTSGWWLKTHKPQVKWQKGSWDRIARSIHEEAHLAWYLVNNPVRAGLVADWTDYPFTGAIGLDLKEFLADLLPFT